MKLGCFQSNKGLRQLDFGSFAQRVAQLGYDTVDIPVGEPDAATTGRSHALARLGRWEEAEQHLATSVETLLSGASRLEAARTHAVWGLLCYDRGDKANAQAHLERAAAQFEASGVTAELAVVQDLLANLGQS